MSEERMLKWFAYEHLPEHLKEVSSRFHGLATEICRLVEPGPERTIALRKLLEAKDAADWAELVRPVAPPPPAPPPAPGGRAD